MKTFIFLLAFAVSGCAQSYHIIRVIPASTTPGSVLFCGDSSHATTCVTDQANAAGTIISTTASRIVGSSDDAYLAVDAGGSARLGFTKKSGVIPRLTYGSGQNFELAQSSGTDIGASNTFTVHFALDQTSGAPTFTFNDAGNGAVFTQSGSGHVISVNVSNSSVALNVANTGSGTAITGTSSTGNGVTGTSSSSTLSGIAGSNFSGGIGVSGTVFGPGTGGNFSATQFGGINGVGLVASSTGTGALAAHFTNGNVLIDHDLTISGTCTGCGSGVTSVTSAGNGLSFSPTTGAVVGSLSQDIRTSAAPTFAGMTLTGLASGSVNSASNGFSFSNSGSGAGISGTSSTGTGVAGTGSSNGSKGGAFSSIGLLGIGLTASASGTGGIGLTASGTSLAAHFLTGNVTIDNALTVTGASTLTGAVGATSGITFGASSNSYFRTFSGAPSCSGVTDGWFGFDTSSGTLYICNGGTATAH